jgi:hypothetical protein
MDGLPVTIRLLDPPLHEFLPNWKEYKEMVAEKSRLETLGTEPEEQQRLEALIVAVEKVREANPMLGHRGCRLGITHPEIYGMQVRAIMEAACTAAQQGVRVEPEIMIPLTGTVGEIVAVGESAREAVAPASRSLIPRTGWSLTAGGRRQGPVKQPDSARTIPDTGARVLDNRRPAATEEMERRLRSRGANYFQREVAYGSFERSFAIPDRVDAAQVNA